MEAGRYMKDRNLYRAHAQAALAQLAKNPMVDANRIAAIGYCFGGAGALELARSGANLKAVVVFHADLTSPTPDDDKNIKGRVLALHGADDPIVPQAEREKFEKEMRDARLDWQLVTYSNAMHCFTDAEAGNGYLARLRLQSRGREAVVPGNARFLPGDAALNARLTTSEGPPRGAALFVAAQE